jgi:hypothetical protein
LHKSFSSSNFDGVTAIEIGAGTGDNWRFDMKLVDIGFYNVSFPNSGMFVRFGRFSTSSGC